MNFSVSGMETKRAARGTQELWPPWLLELDSLAIALGLDYEHFEDASLSPVFTVFHPVIIKEIVSTGTCLHGHPYIFSTFLTQDLPS